MFLAVGAEGWGIEGDQRSAAGLGTRHIFNSRVDILYRPKFTGDQAKASGTVPGGAVMGIPCLLNRRIFMGVPLLRIKNQIVSG